MITFHYKARDQQAKLIEGMMEADSQNAVAVKLKDLGYLPIIISVTQTQSSSRLTWQPFQVIKLSDVNVFTRQLYTLQKAGITLIGSLNAIKEQTNSFSFQRIIEQIIRNIESGMTLSAAMHQHPRVFNSIYISMIKSAEASGKLVEILERLAILGEHDERIRLKINNAMRYPLIVVIAIILAFIILTITVVPRFVSIFSQFKTALPWPTQILIGVHHLVVNYWWLCLLVMFGGAFIFKRFISTKVGAHWWDGIRLKIPIFGSLWLNIIMSRFCRITGILMQSGVPILSVLDLVSEGIGNTVVADVVEDIRTHVNEGKGMLAPMKQSKLFPPLVTQMVAVGEESGRLAELLAHASDYYDSQVDYTVNNLISLIEPLLIFVLGILVLIMALGIFTPMWNLMNLFKA